MAGKDGQIAAEMSRASGQCLGTRNLTPLSPELQDAGDRGGCRMLGTRVDAEGWGQSKAAGGWGQRWMQGAERKGGIVRVEPQDGSERLH